MSVKNTRSIKPTRIQYDKNGKPIQVFRGGIKDNNKYARKTPREKRDDANMGNANYNPEDKS